MCNRCPCKFSGLKTVLVKAAEFEEYLENYDLVDELLSR